MTPPGRNLPLHCSPSRRTAVTAVLAGLLCLLGSRAGAIQIIVDFSYDSVANGGTGFFDSTPLAEAAVQKAAADISNAISASLSSVSSDVFTGTSGGATATVDWKLNLTDPSTNSTITIPTFSLQQDKFTVYVGMQPLTGATLGQGGPVGVGASVGVSGTSANFSAAIVNAQNASNAVMPREGGGGAGPVQGSISGTLAGQAYTLNYGPLAGTLWLDDDTDNNGSVDDAATMAAAWSYDPNAPVASGKSDFYSVALHEILHSLGFGTSATWNSLRSGTNWTGSNAIALNGGNGTNLVTTTGHIRDGYMSTTLLGGVAQEAVMDPSLTVGTRKYLTNMDTAFLRDLGYAAVPEPSIAALLCAGALLFNRRRRSGRRAHSSPSEASSS